jgi:hypothetical protein
MAAPFSSIAIEDAFVLEHGIAGITAESRGSA